MSILLTIPLCVNKINVVVMKCEFIINYQISIPLIKMSIKLLKDVFIPILVQVLDYQQASWL